MSRIDDPHQQEVAERVLTQESEDRRHLVVHLSGAHAYGFPSPDSDLDLKAIHVERTERLLGLSVPKAVRNRLEIIEGVEIDYTSNELQVAVRGLLRGDGNMLERVCTPEPMRASPWLASLVQLARRNLSRKYYHHYRGFAYSQRKAVEQAEAPRAKKVLYVLRTALTGTHLLRTGECIPDLTALYEPYGVGLVPELIEVKQQGETQALPEALIRQVGPAMDRVFELLDQAHEASALPEQPPEVEALERWLLGVRRADLEPALAQDADAGLP
jgi:predicted nucleotidyltransferase